MVTNIVFCPATGWSCPVAAARPRISCATKGAALTLTISSWRCGEYAPPPQLAPPRLPGNSSVGCSDSGVKIPSLCSAGDGVAATAPIPEREAPRVVRRNARRQQRRRPRREGLRRPGLLAGDGARRHGALLHREQRLAVAPVEDEDEALLAHLCQRRHAAAVGAAPVEKHGLGGRVVVPQVVVHELERPGDLAGGQPQRDHRVGVPLLPGRSRRSSRVTAHWSARRPGRARHPPRAAPRRWPRRSRWRLAAGRTSSAARRSRHRRRRPRRAAPRRYAKSITDEPTTTTPFATAGGELAPTSSSP